MASARCPPRRAPRPGTRGGRASVAAGRVIDWQTLRRLTAARIGLGRAGPSVATADHLAFQAAHALARDAVRATLDVEALSSGLRGLGLQPVALRSGCADLPAFLSRPDLGRRLHPEDAARLGAGEAGCDVAFLLAGGLSATAVMRHALPLLGAVLPRLRALGRSVGPVGVVGYGRVALGDAVGERLGARLVVVLVGERPGLSAPDSLGAYLTWAPRSGRSDAERNCLSNIRPEGLPIPEATRRLLWLMERAREGRLTGVMLKDESEAVALPDGDEGRRLRAAP